MKRGRDGADWGGGRLQLAGVVGVLFPSDDHQRRSVNACLGRQRAQAEAESRTRSTEHSNNFAAKHRETTLFSVSDESRLAAAAAAHLAAAAPEA